MEKPRTNELGQPVGAPLPDWNPPPFPEESIIEGRFCRLEPLDTESHAAALFAANARDESGANWTYLPYGPFSEIDEYTAWVESVAAESDPQFYAVISAESGVAAGVLSLLRIKPEAGSIEVG
ncbi:MAG: GNAT family N-acetyltransferase, partial [Verrucomicrobiales bacterium]|nr:GNAT family N-acetyltransferase [Verrucomicrobiales bacterium]